MEKKQFEWTGEGWKRAKEWAMSMPDPMAERPSLWDRVYTHNKESVDILDEINKIRANWIQAHETKHTQQDTTDESL